jgi:chaperonin GroES
LCALPLTRLSITDAQLAAFGPAFDENGARGGRREQYRRCVAANPRKIRQVPEPSPVKQPVTMVNDRILVQLPDPEGERRSRAGILIPATAQLTKRLTWAEVMAVGPNVRTAKPGDKVLFNREDTFEVDVQGEEYLILRERDVQAIATERLDGGTGLYL